MAKCGVRRNLSLRSPCLYVLVKSRWRAAVKVYVDAPHFAEALCWSGPMTHSAPRTAGSQAEARGRRLQRDDLFQQARRPPETHTPHPNWTLSIAVHASTSLYGVDSAASSQHIGGSSSSIGDILSVALPILEARRLKTRFRNRATAGRSAQYRLCPRTCQQQPRSLSPQGSRITTSKRLISSDCQTCPQSTSPSPCSPIDWSRFHITRRSQRNKSASRPCGWHLGQF